MNKYILINFAIILFFGCTKTKKSTSKNKTSTIKIDTIDKVNIKSKKTTIDDFSFIGNIQNFYFLDNNEVYVELYFKKDSISYDDYKNIVKLGDSLIYKDIENSRSRISPDNAKKHLDLRGLDSLNIFDIENNLIDKVKLLRIEYLNQNIDPCFIAVYKTTRKLNSDSYYYCIGNFNKKLDNNKYELTKNSKLTGELVDKFNVPQNYVTDEIKGIHYQIKNSNNKLSIINSDMYSMIIFTALNSSKIYYKSDEVENIESIHILPLNVNGMPLIISECFRPETDVSWNNLLSFDGSNYRIKERQKIKTGANTIYSK